MPRTSHKVSLQVRLPKTAKRTIATIIPAQAARPPFSKFFWSFESFIALKIFRKDNKKPLLMGKKEGKNNIKIMKKIRNSVCQCLSSCFDGAKIGNFLLRATLFPFFFGKKCCAHRVASNHCLAAITN